jgi:cytochrome c peroxidase
MVVATCVAAAGCGVGGSSSDTALKVRIAASAQGLRGSPMLRPPVLTPPQRETLELRIELGRNLFFDHALSGVEQTSCGTCHHAAFQFSDARNIARGVFCDLNAQATQIFCREAPPPGANGNVAGPDRTAPLNSRNSPLLLNNALFPKLMWNGRFRFIDQHSTDVNALDASLGFQFPAPEKRLHVRSLLTGQAHMPVTEAVEMTGDFPEFGEPFEDPDHRNPEVREALAVRISDLPGYRPLFEEAYAPGTRLFAGDPQIRQGDDIPYLAIADAMGRFMETLIFTDAPWDHFLEGDDDAISEAATRGALTFLTTGKCSTCHAGDLFSDFENHNIGVPQVGPGTAQSDLSDPTYRGLRTWDFGLEEINGNSNDRFKFRTPPLRGVALSSPYMHNGAFTKLEDAIRHHADPEASYANYDISQIEPDMRAADGLKPMGPVFDPRNPVVLGRGSGQTRIDLTDAEIADLIEFLKALTDPRMLDTASLAPKQVPSGLPVDVVGPRRFPLYQ